VNAGVVTKVAGISNQKSLQTHTVFGARQVRGDQGGQLPQTSSVGRHTQCGSFTQSARASSAIPDLGRNLEAAGEALLAKAKSSVVKCLLNEDRPKAFMVR
jgi:hypothetical protein